MFKKFVIWCVLIFVAFSLTACISNIDDNNGENKTPERTETNQTDATPTPASTDKKGDPVPTYNEDWPTEMLPDGFPNLGKVTKVSDKRSYGNVITIYWNMITEDQIDAFVDKLNDYLDNDHAWQGSFYSDGVKYKPGTEDEFIRVVIRHMDFASGEVDSDFEPQFYLEISGEGLKK